MLKGWLDKTRDAVGRAAGFAPVEPPRPADTARGLRQRGARAAATFAAGISFDRIERKYGDKRVLAALSLSVEPGEVVCLVGPSGCGKTTLLRVASGVERPTGGRVLINNVEVAGPDKFVPPEQRGVGLMFQDFALFPHLTLVENVAFGLRTLTQSEARAEALAMLDRVGLAAMADAYPHVLSGGQQQRVALARAIVPRPAVILMDEPFSGLDVQLRDAMQEETLAILRETRATSLIVTHHPEEAMRLADRIAVLRSGRIVQTGTAEDLYSHPGDLFVARLFSEINEVGCKVTGGAVDTPLGRIAATGISDGEAAILCLRERGLAVTAYNGRKLPAPKLAGAKVLPGRVMFRRFLGDVCLLELAVEGFEGRLRARVSGDGTALRRGNNVTVEIDPAKALVFPANGSSPVE